MRAPARGGRGGFGGRGGGGRGGFGGRGGGFGGRGGYNRQPEGPPEEVVEAGEYVHPCEGEMVCKLTNTMIPYFNAPIFLENKTQVGKVDEILGQINSVYFTVKMSEGVLATSYSQGDKFFIDPQKLLPLERFLPRPKGAPGAGGGGRGRGGGRGGGRGFGGGRGGGRGFGGGGRGFGGGGRGFGGGGRGFGGGRSPGGRGFGGGRGRGRY